MDGLATGWASRLLGHALLASAWSSNPAGGTAQWGQEQHTWSTKPDDGVPLSGRENGFLGSWNPIPAEGVASASATKRSRDDAEPASQPAASWGRQDWT